MLYWPTCIPINVSHCLNLNAWYMPLHLLPILTYHRASQASNKMRRIPTSPYSSQSQQWLVRSSLAYSDYFIFHLNLMHNALFAFDYLHRYSTWILHDQLYAKRLAVFIALAIGCCKSKIGAATWARKGKEYQLLGDVVPGILPVGIRCQFIYIVIRPFEQIVNSAQILKL